MELRSLNGYKSKKKYENLDMLKILIKVKEYILREERNTRYFRRSLSTQHKFNKNSIL